MKQPLRIALLLDSYSLTAWSFSMIEKIIASNYAMVSLLVLNDTAPSVRPSFTEILKEKSKYFLYDLYTRHDARKFRPGTDAFATKDAATLLKDIPVVKAKTEQRKHSHFFSEDDVSKIREYKPDVMVRLGFGILRGDILAAAKYGVWSYHHGDNRVNRGGPAGFWEVREDHPVTGSVLQILSEDLDNGTVIYRSYAATHKISVNLNKNNFYWKSLDFVPRKLKELYDEGEESFFARAKELNPAPHFYSRQMYSPRQATNAAMLGFMYRQMLRYGKELLTDKLYKEHWFLLFSLTPGLSTSLSRFKKIVPPADRFWADPHVIHRNGNYYIFVEEFMYRTRKGHIALLVMDESGNYTAPVPVLERPYHLSYPFVFEDNGTYYMIPESGANKAIELYRSTAFPGKWEFVKNILSGVRAVDATLFHYRNTWWLFTNIVTNEGASSHDELFLFYANDLFSDTWKPHPRNPIVSDVRRARPAGRMFMFDGKICRPSQDCSQGYGTAVVINEVSVLDKNEYHETELCRVSPAWDKSINGMHTLCHEGNLTMFDGKERIRK